MKRLTERFSNGQAAVYGCGNNCQYDYKYCNNFLEDCPTINEIYEKLATYEELEDKLETVYGECDGLLKTVVNSLVKHEGAEFDTPAKARILTDEDVDKWESFKDAEEQGLLFKMPCKPGDTVWVIDSVSNKPISFKVSRIQIGRLHDSITMTDKSIFTIWGKYWDEYFNGHIYPTKEEAEQALERMEKENG